MGESFDVQLNTGTISFSIPLRAPPGVAGHQPNLSLTYNPGIPNGPFGPGWALSSPLLQRKTDDGQPSYTTNDVIADSSGESLIRMTDGTYRREYELDGQFARVDRFGEGWRSRSKSGVTMLYGQFPSPANSNRLSRVGRYDTRYDETQAWMLDAIVDINGNRVDYYYRTFADSPGVLYLDRVAYSVFGTNGHEVAFEYEVRDDCENLASNRAGLAMYTAGFVQLYGRRCVAAQVSSSGQPVRRYTFDYRATAAGLPEIPPPDAIVTKVARLRAITMRDSHATSQLPPMTLCYAEFRTSGVVSRVLADVPWAVSGSAHNGVDLFDVNSDGLPDILNGAAGGLWEYALNRDGLHVEPVPTLMTNSPGYPLSSSSAQVVDFNSDGFVDVANKSSANPGDAYAYQLYRGRGEWDPERYFTSNPPFQYNDPDIALLDLDFDKDIDVMRFHSGGQSLFYQEDGVWTEQDRPWGHADLADLPQNTSLSDGNHQMADLNGDRLLDLVEVLRIGVELEIGYWPSMGGGRFAARKAFAPTVYTYADTDNMLFLDINGDGLTDLAKIDAPDRIDVRLNCGDGTWSPALYIPSPTYTPGSTALRIADVNGNGSTDLLFCQTAAGTYEYLDLMSDAPAPGQVVVVDTGMGKRTFVHYRSLADYMAEAASNGRPWSLTIPFAMQVVSGYDIQIGQDLDGLPGPDRYVTRIQYRDPYYDAEAKEFRGFAFVEKVEHGDEWYGVTNGPAPGGKMRIAYHPGAPDGIDNDGDGLVDEKHGEDREEHALKGMILWQESTDVGSSGTELWPYNTNDFLPDAAVYSRSYNEMSVRTAYATNSVSPALLSVDPGVAIRFPVVTRTVTEQVEKGAGPKRVLATTSDFDGVGNGIRTEEFGDITPGYALDDERLTVMTYLYDTNAWLLDRPLRVLITDEGGNWVKETRFAYDALGRPTNNIAYLDSVTPVTNAVIVYDAYGNAVCRQDARGFCISNVFDGTFHTFPVEEYVQIGFGKPELTSFAEYDPRYGTTMRVTDYNGNTTELQYDSFARLVGIVAPGDTPALPGKRFRYVICDDLRGWCYDYAPSGALTLTTNHAVGSIASQLWSYQREQFGQTGVVEAVAYSDGMGRKLSAQIEDEGGFSVTESAFFNVRGMPRISYFSHPAAGGFLADTNAPHTEFVYDALGRAVRTTLPPDPAGIRHYSRTEFLPLKTISYDLEDTVAGGAHAGTPSSSEEDGLGRLIRSIDVNRQGVATGEYVTVYSYNLLDNLVRIVDPQGNVKTNTFDGWGRKTASYDPDAGQFLYHYDIVGNLVETVDAKGQRNRYAYDGANRRLSEDYGGDGTDDVRYTYDATIAEYPAFQNLKGGIARVDDQSGACFFDYDARGNLREKIKRVRRRNGNLEDYRFGAAYDAMDRMTVATFPDGEQISYAFNARGLLKSIPGVVTSIVYNAAAQRTSMACANGVVSTYQYDLRQRLRNLDTHSPFVGAGDIQHLTYTLDGANNMLAMADGRSMAPSDPRNMSQTFVMDDLYRLTQAVGSGYGTINHTYDKLGNMLSMTSADIADPRVNHGVRAFAGGTSNRVPRLPGGAPGPHALTGTQSGYAVIYDDNGNMRAARGNVYEWDSLNRLSAVASSNGVLRFVYDYSGSRVLKYLEEQPTNEVVYLSSSYEFRDGKAVKFIFAGPVRAARIEGEVPIPVRLTQHEALRTGWNLVPVNVVLSNGAPAAVVAPISASCGGVYKNHEDGYLTYLPGQGGNTLTNLEPGQAYWVYVTQDCSLEMTGPAFRAQAQSLQAGWQAMALAAPDRQDLSTLVASNGHILAVWKYDRLMKKFLQMDKSVSPALWTHHAVLPGEALLLNAGEAADLQPVLSDNRVFFFHADHLGSGNLVTDEAGMVVEELYYYPYGLQRHRHTPNGDIYGSEYTFSDKELDAEIQLSYFGARYYDPVLCAFISVDPVAQHSPGKTLGNSLRLNAYIYAGDNPLVLVDPDGRFWTEVLTVAAVVVASVCTMGTGAAFAFAVGAGALIGAVSASENGGNILQGAALGALSGAVGYGIGAGVGAGLTKAGLGAGTSIAGGAAAGAIAGGATTYLSAGVMSLITSGKWQNATMSSILHAMASGAVGGALGGYSSSKSGQAVSDVERNSVEATSEYGQVPEYSSEQYVEPIDADNPQLNRPKLDSLPKNSQRGCGAGVQRILKEQMGIDVAGADGKDWGPNLGENYHNVGQAEPDQGAIRVFDATDGHKWGHVEIHFNGKWYSDFQQFGLGTDPGGSAAGFSSYSKAKWTQYNPGKRP